MSEQGSTQRQATKPASSPPTDDWIGQVGESMDGMTPERWAEHCRKGDEAAAQAKAASSSPTAGRFHRSLVKMLDEITPEEFDRRRKQAEEEEDRMMGRRR